ncbi:hypothetical protein CAPTEDRAFT_187178 [Capitella teleta]|uniref:Cadherin domain-containing protein n=1 Tax=Capitella teleta TaxID=283909 RepID=R7VFY9_CAPTE|nr:hypothetical protein CAPTEDRAFT_187178 [Capitella teleta]|eukprot:ELU15196.1 hypothetical protein CAPTEDRAFT_187178 [Capitella teleta]
MDRYKVVSGYLIYLLVIAIFEPSEAAECAGNPTVVGCHDFASVNDVAADRTAVVLAHDTWKSTCCGVIVGWKMKAGRSGNIDLQTWTLVDAANGIANMQDSNTVAVDIANGEDVQIDITDKTQQLPVSVGTAIGFLAETQDIVKVRLDADCAAPAGCAKTYLYSIFPGALPATYAPGTDYTFDSDGWLDNDVNGREYALSALVEPGDAPVVSNLPAEIYVPPETPVGNEIFDIEFSDTNTKQTLTLTATITPNAGTFDIDVATGKITVITALEPGPTNYVIAVGVSDGCLTTSLDLTVVIGTEPLTAAPVEEPSFFETTVGRVVIGLLATLGLVLILVLVAVYIMALYTKHHQNSSYSTAKYTPKPKQTDEMPLNRNTAKEPHQELPKQTTLHGHNPGEQLPPPDHPTDSSRTVSPSGVNMDPDYNQGYQDALNARNRSGMGYDQPSMMPRYQGYPNMQNPMMAYPQMMASAQPMYVMQQPMVGMQPVAGMQPMPGMQPVQYAMMPQMPQIQYIQVPQAQPAQPQPPPQPAQQPPQVIVLAPTSSSRRSPTPPTPRKRTPTPPPTPPAKEEESIPTPLPDVLTPRNVYLHSDRAPRDIRFWESS